VSWKAYCYRDEAEARRTAEHVEDLTQEEIVERLVADLRERGRITGPVPEPRELALTIVDEYVRFPTPAAEDA
jgi:hypothetical protein